MNQTPRICPGCGDTFGSRYHEVAHSADVNTASIEDLEAAAAIYDRAVKEATSDSPSSAATPPANCPLCNGERELDGTGGIACYFCGLRESRA